MTDIKHLEEELRNLEKQKIEVEQRLRQIERKEKETDAIARRKAQITPSNKRQHDGRVIEETATKRLRNEPSRSSDNVDLSDDEDRESGRARQVLSSHSDFRLQFQKPKLSSAVVAPSSTSSGSSKSTTSDDKESQRHKKMFGKLLLGTLQQFKSSIQNKSEAARRREETEHKIDAKVKEEQETFVDKEQRLIHEQKEKELQRKIEITRQYEEKQLEILSMKWQTHKNQLSRFIRTETKPYIYYAPKSQESVNSEDKAEDKDDVDKESKETNKKTEEDNSKAYSPSRDHDDDNDTMKD